MFMIVATISQKKIEPDCIRTSEENTTFSFIFLQSYDLQFDQDH